VGDVDSLHVEIDNLNDPLVGFCFIRSIDITVGAVQQKWLLNVPWSSQQTRPTTYSYYQQQKHY
jgi:hypothetical protein